MSPTRHRDFLHTEMPHEGRFARIEAWAEQQMGASTGSLGPVEVRERLPRQMGLRYNSKATGSPNGGRFDFHLRHLPDTEVIERVARADRFLERTSSPPRPVSAPPRRETEPPRQADDRRTAPGG